MNAPHLPPAPMTSDERRAIKGREIAETKGAINRVSSEVFTVASQSGPGAYRVEIDAGAGICNCPDWVKHDGALDCKHLLGVRFYLERQSPVLPPPTLVRRPTPIYRRNWSGYNRAQIEEIPFFDTILAALVEGVEDPRPVQGRGHPRVPLKDLVFCATQKVYSQLGLREARHLFAQAKGESKIEHAPSFSLPSIMLNREDVTPILKHLIAKSALPLATMEHEFGIDSTGFRTTCFGAWNREVHGDRRVNQYLKAHALCGINTHIVVQVEITDKNGADYPQFEPLVRGASHEFVVKRLLADKAYTGRSNYSLAEELGFEFFSPFRINDTPRPTSSKRSLHEPGRRPSSRLWQKMWHFFQMHLDRFNEVYHQRSNVEAVFSAIKRKFGETLKSRNQTAQVNELLCKILAYNITVLIHEMFENGVTPDFLQIQPAHAATHSLEGLPIPSMTVVAGTQTALN